MESGEWSKFYKCRFICACATTDKFLSVLLYEVIDEDQKGSICTSWKTKHSLLQGHQLREFRTYYAHLKIHKSIWISPDKGTKNEIVMCQYTSVLNYRCDNINSDHFHVTGQLRCRISTSKP